MAVCLNTKPFNHVVFEAMASMLKEMGTESLELHLNHPALRDNPTAALGILKKYGLGVSIVDGGWADFSKSILEVPEQIEIARIVGAEKIRLFFPERESNQVNEKDIKQIIKNIIFLAENHPDIRLLFETDAGFGLDAPRVFHIMEVVQKEVSNVGIVFDPVNFIMGGQQDYIIIFSLLEKYIEHIHLKGVKLRVLGPFGVGDVKFSGSFLKKLWEKTESFGLEYEGDGDPIIGLTISKENLDAEREKWSF